MTNHSVKNSSWYKFKNILGKVLIYAGLALYALWILMPFAIVFLTSFKPDSEVGTSQYNLFPKEWVLLGYEAALNYGANLSGNSAMITGLINTLMYVLPPTILGLTASALAAFAFSKMKFKGSNFLFGFLLMTMLIPGSVMLVPSYVIYDTIGWTNSPLPLLIPGMFGAAACVFFLKQFFTGIPTELVEAAKLDGLGFFGIFAKIFVPLSLPALFAQGLLGFIGGYNDYFGPYIYLTDPDSYTLQVVIHELADTITETPSIMAACILAMIPTILIYLFCQKYFVEGISTSGMKL